MCVWCVVESRVGGAFDRASKQDRHKQRHTWLRISFLITQQHVWDPVGDGEHMSRLWALQGALHHLYLQQYVVHLPQKCLILLIPLNQPCGHLTQTKGIGHLLKHCPLHLGFIRTTNSGLNSTTPDFECIIKVLI